MSLMFPMSTNHGIYAAHIKGHMKAVPQKKKQAAMNQYLDPKWETGYEAFPPPPDRAMFWIDGLIEHEEPITEKMRALPGCPAGEPRRVILKHNYDKGCSIIIGLELDVTPKTERFNRFFCLVSAVTPNHVFRSKIQQNYPNIFKRWEDVNFAVLKIFGNKQDFALVEIAGQGIDAIRHATDPLAPPQPPEPVFIPMDITIGD